MIFIIPVSCLIVFAGVFIQCVIIKQDPKLQRGDVDIKSILMRVALELGFITECALGCKGLVTYTRIQIDVQSLMHYFECSIALQCIVTWYSLYRL